jgi:hypothetical protein
VSRAPVCVFAKPPVAGQSKTRLARGVGAERAAELARAFFLDVWATVTALPWARPVLACTTTDVAAFGAGEVEVWLQGEGDLGERMARVLGRGIAEAGRAFVLGADVPGLPRAHLDAACAALEGADAVLAPTFDGGFYLLGLSRLPPGLLDGLPWSAADTRARTEERLAAAGLAIASAPAWFDVDEPADLERLRAHLAAHPEAAPRTRAALGALS